MSTPANAIECLPVPTLYQYPRALPGSSPLHHAVDSGAGDQQSIVPPLQNFANPNMVSSASALRNTLIVFLPTSLAVRRLGSVLQYQVHFIPLLNPVIWVACAHLLCKSGGMVVCFGVVRNFVTVCLSSSRL